MPPRPGLSDNPGVFLVAMDDTDTPDTIGTGRLARNLSEALSRRLGTRRQGVTRHQLLVHPAIPYTSHNSCACLAVGDCADQRRLEDFCRGFLREHFNPGADPGLAICEIGRVSSRLTSFGLRAQQEVLEKSEAVNLATEEGIFLEELGGTGGGVIGALAGVGLRASGNDGRFLLLDGIRGLEGSLKVKTILSRSPIARVILHESGVVLGPEAEVDTRNWVRPILMGGQAVLPVRQTPEGGFATLREKKKKGDNEE